MVRQEYKPINWPEVKSPLKEPLEIHYDRHFFTGLVLGAIATAALTYGGLELSGTTNESPTPPPANSEPWMPIVD